MWRKAFIQLVFVDRDLQFNMITSIEADAFTGLGALTTLYVRCVSSLV